MTAIVERSPQGQGLPELRPTVKGKFVFVGDEKLMIDSAEQFSRGEVLPLAERLDHQEEGLMPSLIKKAGAHFSFGDTRIGLGRENAKEFLRQNPEVAAEIEEQIRANAKDFYALKVGAATEA